MLNRWFIFPMLVIIFSGCRKEYPEPESQPMIGGYSSFTLGSRYLSHSGNELNIQLDIAFVYGGNGFDDMSVHDSVFHNFEFATHWADVTSVQGIQLQENNSYSHLICLDMSQGWHAYDQFNIKTRALTKSIREGKSSPMNEIGIGSYARGGYYVNETIIWTDSTENPFQESTNSLQRILLDRYWEYAGTSNLYDAACALIPTHAYYSSHANKQMTIFSHGLVDDNNVMNADSVILFAKEAGVKVNLVVLAGEFDTELPRIALETGGFLHIISATNYKNLYMYNPMDEGAPTMASLNRILSGNQYIYRVDLKLTKKTGNWSSGMTVYEFYQTLERLPGDTEPFVNNYVPYYVEIP